ncbi:MAG TPA: glutamate synthase large subunit [Campylobacterales bacterium]|nr:glutamate synthase large subunit [Campylobacterales bacterium]
MEFNDMKQEIQSRFKDNCGFGLIADIKNRASHQILENAITALERMMHRGAIAADGKTGDGSGLLLSMPHQFMKKVTSQAGIDLPNQYGVAMVFTKDEKQIERFSEVCEENDIRVLYIRDVPVDKNALGEQALQTLPMIKQIVVVPNSIMATKRFRALLYLVRKIVEHEFEGDRDFYIASLSDSVLSYKGLVMPTHIKEFYKDLNDRDFQISFALFHQRFSTNTLPEWRLAQPFRTIAHNGEINSVSANKLNVQIKSESMKSNIFSDEELEKLFPIIQKGGSDSASFDNFFEFLIINGMDFFKAVRSMVPAPWQNAPYIDAEMRAYYEYQSSIFEAWDGPAAVSLTNGRYIATVLDRNGLRPAKYVITKGGTFLVSSEYGVIDIPEDEIIERGRLQSGEMIGLDLKFGKILKNGEINDYLKSSQHYGEWLNSNTLYIQEHISEPTCDIDGCDETLQTKQQYFNITHEVIEQVIEPMFKDGKEAVGSMGDDTPLAPFSKQHRNFSDFFRQKFAQVTNPPIDPIREKVVMSLNTGFGQISNILEESPEHAKRIKTTSPILTQEEFDILLSFGDEEHPRYEEIYKNRTYSTIMKSSLKESLNSLVYRIVEDVKSENIRVVILSDREVSKEFPTIPMLMVVGKLNQTLLENKIRHKVSIVAVSGEVHDSHSSATLIAFGATAIYPYLLFATVHELLKNRPHQECKDGLKSVRTALNNGLLKIMSKMGISTIASYRNSSLFDIIGLSKEITIDCFPDAVNLIDGLTYQDIEERIRKAHLDAFEDSGFKRIYPLDIGGFYKYISGKEFHDFSPAVIHAIHEGTEGKGFDKFRELVNSRGLKFIRDFFKLESDREPISIDEVEPREEIFKRFATAAMSLGSISPEAHEALAEAMNRIGGQSNSGEGGESKERFKTIKNSKIKQVASGRFGVTPAYLRSAEEIQIKIAQGAKPGEGGQLPGHKVTPLIAELRYTIPGVTLISPPPHHDIYSIEDLAQLIFDLKQVNPDAKIAVKLVSTSGVGTIASGVAKAYADKIIISGGDGGTGAAPLTSIKFAGNPWEIGLSEAHNSLKANGLREFVELQTDGGLKTGLDVVKAAILGAESFAFGTTALTILGCKLLRVCHLNRCSVGIATQDETLRSEHYKGTVDKLISYFTFVADDIREILAKLGYSSLDEIIGKTHLLKVIDDEFAKKFDFSNILMRIEGKDTCTYEHNEPFDDNSFEKEILKEVRTTIKNPQDNIVIHREIKNLNRSFGARISGDIAKYYGDKGLPEDSIKINLSGTAGQSLGAFLINGVSIYLNGVANDYVGKGMSGGKIVISSKLQGDNFSILGNTCLYGATGGKLFASGSAGERFAVRNSGTIAVVEGTGDHACEYMTGGIVCILGKTGLNFGAGMTGGIAFIYDKEHTFIENMNQELIQATRIDTDDTNETRHYLKRLLKEYYNETGSKKAKYILDNFRAEIRDFWLVQPKNMKKLILNPDDGD